MKISKYVALYSPNCQDFPHTVDVIVGSSLMVYDCVSVCVRQESLQTDLAQVREEYTTNKDNSKKTIQVSCHHRNITCVTLEATWLWQEYLLSILCTLGCGVCKVGSKILRWLGMTRYKQDSHLNGH